MSHDRADDPRHKASPTVDVPRDVWEHVVREHYYGEGVPDPEDVGMQLMEHVFLYPEWRVPDLTSEGSQEDAEASTADD